MMDPDDKTELYSMMWDEDHPEPEEYTERMHDAMESINEISSQLNDIYGMGNNQCSDELRDIADELKSLADELDELEGWRINGFRGD